MHSLLSPSLSFSLSALSICLYPPPLFLYTWCSFSLSLSISLLSLLCPSVFLFAFYISLYFSPYLSLLSMLTLRSLSLSLSLRYLPFIRNFALLFPLYVYICALCSLFSLSFHSLSLSLSLCASLSILGLRPSTLYVDWRHLHEELF